MPENDLKVKKKLKKEIKWYTYVDSDLDGKLKKFMLDCGFTNQAKLMRICVNNFIDYVNLICKKKWHEEEGFDGEKLDEFIRDAISAYEEGDSFQEVLKQKISPLKVAVLMLEKLLDEPDRFFSVFSSAKVAINELENVIKQKYEEPKLVRFVKKIDILYIEDNELERKTVDTYFKRNGVNIRSIETSDEGLYLLKELTPKVILLDINLKTSKLNGDQFCRILKSNGEYKSIPIILISALITESEKGRILEITQADGIIIKPIEKLRDLDVLFKYVKEF
ncbi:MAG: response regulator [Promethearchaeota archaeon]|nr:MAG: response regulator [Candidatus Lokiarchaeota archaeon]